MEREHQLQSAALAQSSPAKSPDTATSTAVATTAARAKDNTADVSMSPLKRRLLGYDSTEMTKPKQMRFGPPLSDVKHETPKPAPGTRSPYLGVDGSKPTARNDVKQDLYMDSIEKLFYAEEERERREDQARRHDVPIVKQDADSSLQADSQQIKTEESYGKNLKGFLNSMAEADVRHSSKDDAVTNSVKDDVKAFDVETMIRKELEKTGNAKRANNVLRRSIENSDDANISNHTSSPPSHREPAITTDRHYAVQEEVTPAVVKDRDFDRDVVRRSSHSSDDKTCDNKSDSASVRRSISRVDSFEEGNLVICEDPNE